MDSPKIQALFAQTLRGDYENEEAWEAVSALRSNGSPEVFAIATEWCHSDIPLKRARAAAILCQLRRAPAPNTQQVSPNWMFRDESYALITKMLENDHDPLVLDSVISALGHLRNPKAIPLILRFQDHPNRDIRFALAFALGCFPNDAQSTSGLMKLTLDSDSEVRDWAVFGLGVQGDADSPEIREALLRCLNDADDDVREEAAVGLAKRKDQRVIPKLRAMLDEPELHVRVAEAAAALLALEQVPQDWTAADYKNALRNKFNLKE